MILYFNRKTQEYEQEKEYQGKLLEFLYTTVIGRILLKLIVARPWFSRLRAHYQKSKGSKKDIAPFIEEYQIDTTPYEKNWECFNDFFTRKRAYCDHCDADTLVAIADARLSVDDYHRYVFPDDGELLRQYPIKGELHTVRPISEKYHVYSRNLCRTSFSA